MSFLCPAPPAQRIHIKSANGLPLWGHPEPLTLPREASGDTGNLQMLPCCLGTTSPYCFPTPLSGCLFPVLERMLWNSDPAILYSGTPSTLLRFPFSPISRAPGHGAPSQGPPATKLHTLLLPAANRRSPLGRESSQTLPFILLNSCERIIGLWFLICKANPEDVFVFYLKKNPVSQLRKQNESTLAPDNLYEWYDPILEVSSQEFASFLQLTCPWS